MSTEIVVLHSSPLHQQRDLPITPPSYQQYVPNSSSSPTSSLPSAKSFLKRYVPRLKTRSNASSFAQNANLGSQSMSELVGQRKFGIDKEVVNEEKVETAKPSIKCGRPKTVAKQSGGTKKAKELKPKTKRKPERTKTNANEAKSESKNKIGLGKGIAGQDDMGNNLLVLGVKVAGEGSSKVVKMAAETTRKRKRKDPDGLKETKPRPVKPGPQNGSAKSRKPRKKTGITSDHFGHGETSERVKTIDADNLNDAANIADIAEPTTLAGKRRMSWTPVKDTAQTKSKEYEVNDVPSSPQPKSGTQKTGFLSMIGSFGYTDTSPTVNASREDGPVVALHKRRRVEFIGTTTLIASKPEENIQVPAETEPSATAVTKVKKKSPKKPAFSITAKVMAKYGKPATLITEKTSVFFPPRIETPAKEAGSAKKTTKARRKESSKPRASRDVVGEATMPEKPKSRVAKPKKAAPAKKVAPAVQKLLSPSNITRKTQQQDVLFGTSSQLLTGDSPRAVRGLQQALKESKKMMSNIQEEPISTAPVQRRQATAIRRTSGKMWAEQAESFEDDTLLAVGLQALPTVEEPKSPTLPEPLANHEHHAAVSLTSAYSVSVGFSADDYQTLSDEIGEMDCLVPLTEDLNANSQHDEAGGFVHVEEEYVSGDFFSDLKIVDDESIPDFVPQPAPRLSRGVGIGSPSASAEDDSNWKEIDDYSPLHSLKQTPEITREGSPSVSGAEDSNWKDIDNYSPLEDQKQAAKVEPRRDTIPFVSMRTQSSSPIWQNRSSIRSTITTQMLSQLATFVPPPNLSGRAALRPLSTNAKSPKKRATLEKKVTKSSKNTKTNADKSPKRKRGRPPKMKTTDQTLQDGPSKTALPLQVTPNKGSADGGSAEKDWQHIDEIEDSEPDMTPSPRRGGRKPRRSPLPDLVNFTTEAVAVNKRVNTVLATANHPHWPEIQAKLFPDITLAVKGQPRSFGGAKPTWYEKMLMYDPIVIEDLTSFVTERGVRIMVKDKEEVVRGWMVQKWCEENSVCCLWKEGLRGGVKAKY